jgi:hypothetical protein
MSTKSKSTAGVARVTRVWRKELASKKKGKDTGGRLTAVARGREGGKSYKLLSIVRKRF